jgi:hypothetical protein
MSHWMQGKVEDLHCSLDKMREAIINVMPEWEQHIQTSPKGDITVHSSHTGESKSGYHIRIAENSNIGIRYCDFGMKQLDDGTWRIEYDRGGLPNKMKNAPNALKDEVAAMAMKERAEIHKLNMIEDTKGKNRRQVIRMTPQEAQRFLETM